MRVRTLVADAFAAPWGRRAFLQGNIPGATSPKGPLVQAKAVFGGVAPARQSVRPLFAGRTARIANPLPDKALARLRVLRPRRTEGFLCGLNVLRRGIFPATAVRWCCAGSTTARQARERQR